MSVGSTEFVVDGVVVKREGWLLEISYGRIINLNLGDEDSMGKTSVKASAKAKAKIAKVAVKAGTAKVKAKVVVKAGTAKKRVNLTKSPAKMPAKKKQITKNNVKKNVKTVPKATNRPAKSNIKSQAKVKTPVKTRAKPMPLSGEYMNEEQLAHFRGILLNWKAEIMSGVDVTKTHMQEDLINYPDLVDRANQEEGFALELRNRDRERKLLHKIDAALERIRDKSYGYCDDCGAEIGLKRLEARPIATQCVECKSIAEVREKQLGDNH